MTYFLPPTFRQKKPVLRNLRGKHPIATLGKESGEVFWGLNILIRKRAAHSEKRCGRWGFWTLPDVPGEFC